MNENRSSINMKVMYFQLANYDNTKVSINFSSLFLRLFISLFIDTVNNLKFDDTFSVVDVSKTDANNEHSRCKFIFQKTLSKSTPFFFAYLKEKC